MDSSSCNPQEGSRCTTPIKSKEHQGKLQEQRSAAAALCSDRKLTTKCSRAVTESPTFFNSSPFKVLSPQPTKFLKSLLPVKEEIKAKRALEARPLLGQEVRSCSLLHLSVNFTKLHVYVSHLHHVLIISTPTQTRQADEPPNAAGRYFAKMSQTIKLLLITAEITERDSQENDFNCVQPERLFVSLAVPTI